MSKKEFLALAAAALVAVAIAVIAAVKLLPFKSATETDGGEAAQLAAETQAAGMETEPSTETEPETERTAAAAAVSQTGKAAKDPVQELEAERALYEEMLDRYMGLKVKYDWDSGKRKTDTIKKYDDAARLLEKGEGQLKAAENQYKNMKRLL